MEMIKRQLDIAFFHAMDGTGVDVSRCVTELIDPLDMDRPDYLYVVHVDRRHGGRFSEVIDQEPLPTEITDVAARIRSRIEIMGHVNQSKT